MREIFNSTFEVTLRILLVLSGMKISLRQEQILYIDFLCCYSADYGLAEENLNGKSNIKLAELALRRKKIRSALKQAVLDGFVVPFDADDGILYKISGKGENLAGQLNSTYANRYKNNVEIVNERFSEYSDKKLLDFVLSRQTEE